MEGHPSHSHRSGSDVRLLVRRQRARPSGLDGGTAVSLRRAYTVPFRFRFSYSVAQPASVSLTVPISYSVHLPVSLTVPVSVSIHLPVSRSVAYTDFFSFSLSSPISFTIPVSIHFSVSHAATRLRGQIHSRGAGEH